MTNTIGRNTRDPTSKPSCVNNQPRRVENNTLMQRTSRLAYNNHQIFITGFGSYVVGLCTAHCVGIQSGAPSLTWAYF